MKAQDQWKLLDRIDQWLGQSLIAAGQLPGGQPLTKKLIDTKRLVEAWKSDQEAELPEPVEGHELPALPGPQ